MSEYGSKVRRTQEALEFIRAYTIEHGYPPNRREICESVGIQSTSTGQVLLKRMVDEGLIEVAPGLSRGISIKGSKMEIVKEQL